MKSQPSAAAPPAGAAARLRPRSRSATRARWTWAMTNACPASGPPGRSGHRAIRNKPPPQIPVVSLSLPSPARRGAGPARLHLTRVGRLQYSRPRPPMATRDEFLELLWNDVIDSPARMSALDNIIQNCRRDPHGPFGDAGAAIERLLALGASRRD